MIGWNWGYEFRLHGRKSDSYVYAEVLRHNGLEGAQGEVSLSALLLLALVELCIVYIHLQTFYI